MTTPDNDRWRITRPQAGDDRNDRRLHPYPGHLTIAPVHSDVGGAVSDLRCGFRTAAGLRTESSHHGFGLMLSSRIHQELDRDSAANQSLDGAIIVYKQVAASNGSWSAPTFA
jgi:hypothetical protein